VLATLSIGGAGLWLYNETKMDKSLSVLAKAPIPARQLRPAPSIPPQPGATQAALAAPAGTPAATPLAAAPPELANSAIPASPATLAEPAATAAAPPADPAPRLAGSAPEKDAGQETNEAGAAPELERPRKRAAAKSKAAPAAPPQARYASENTRRQDKSARAGRPERDSGMASGDPLKETLRQCRAAGYHAARCVQLGCNATKYGLVCKGGTAARR
jgi:hypothetical protein